jgi:hypothetical protein
MHSNGEGTPCIIRKGRAKSPQAQRSGARVELPERPTKSTPPAGS